MSYRIKQVGNVSVFSWQKVFIQDVPQACLLMCLLCRGEAAVGDPQAGLHLCPSPAFLHKLFFALNKIFNHTCYSICLSNDAGTQAMALGFPTPPPHTPSSLHLNTC